MSIQELERQLELVANTDAHESTGKEVIRTVRDILAALHTSRDFLQNITDLLALRLDALAQQISAQTMEGKTLAHADRRAVTALADAAMVMQANVDGENAEGALRARKVPSRLQMAAMSVARSMAMHDKAASNPFRSEPLARAYENECAFVKWSSAREKKRAATPGMGC